MLNLKKNLFTAGLLPAALLLACSAALAAPESYTIDSSHTYPSFKAAHIGGISFWRGKIDKNSGAVVLDRAAKTGSIEILMDMTSIDFGMDKMNEHAKKEDFFDVAKYPTATYKSTKLTFSGDTLTAVDGDLTLHGVTKPVRLTVNQFKCIPHPFYKREVCGADASATIDRTDFGVSYGVGKAIPDGKVTLEIQVEALKDEAAGPAG
ncbi:YceI family protein [Nevskia ramosa]|uniref:YceI family protein n=1 Tax=Nevskia ramosa TaxID=64002 RepID=UPI0003B345A6|nr:YceI family protein [Nevskia ramosa]